MKTPALHPACLLFPEMQPGDYEELKADMKLHGQRMPVITYKGLVIDGRHRLRAAEELGLTPLVEEWQPKPDESVVEYVVSLNMHRRTLTASQKATVAAGMLPLLEEEAKERQKRGKTPPPPARADLSPKLGQGQTGKSAAIAAKSVGVSRGYVEDAKKLQKESPETFEQVKAGAITLSEAKKKTPPPPPAKVKPKDQLGNVITDPDIVAAFADEKLAELGNRCDALRRDIEAVANNPHLRIQQIATDLRNVKAAIRFATPYALCPKHNKTGKCPVCAGEGWVPKDVYEQMKETRK